jgi:hypothetical protein
MEGEHDGGVGLGEESSTPLLSTIPESVEALCYELSTPVKSSKLSDSPTSLLSTIPKSDEVLGYKILTLVKSSKRLSDSSEYVGELGFDGHMSVKKSKQMKVFQRRESPLSKSMKSWVAERVSWNGGRGCDVTTKDLSGKNHTVCLDSEELIVNVFSVLGKHEELGFLGGMGNQEEENPGVEGTLPQFEAEIPLEEQLVQGIDLVSPISKDLKLVWDVKGTAGLSYDGQEGKFKELLGQIVTNKYGERVSSSSGVDTDDNMGMRDEDIVYEA